MDSGMPPVPGMDLRQQIIAAMAQQQPTPNPRQRPNPLQRPPAPNPLVRPGQNPLENPPTGGPAQPMPNPLQRPPPPGANPLQRPQMNPNPLQRPPQPMLPGGPDMQGAPPLGPMGSGGSAPVEGMGGPPGQDPSMMAGPAGIQGAAPSGQPDLMQMIAALRTPEGRIQRMGRQY